MKSEKTFACTFSAILYCLFHMVDATKQTHLYKIDNLSQGKIYQIEQQSVLQSNPFENFDAICSYHEKALRATLSNKQGIVRLKPEDELRNNKLLALCELISDEVSLKSGDKHAIKKLSSPFKKSQKKPFPPSVDKLKGFLKFWDVDNDFHLASTHEPLNSRKISDVDNMHSSTNMTTSARTKRSAAKLLHKLIRIPPAQNFTEKTFSKENTTADVKLNTSSFSVPYNVQESIPESVDNTTMSYEQIEDLAFADLNGTEIELNDNSDDEQLPNPEELVSGPRYRVYNKNRPNLQKSDIKRKRIPIRSHQLPVLQKKCERFTASMCIKADDYPMEQIMGSIRRHKNAMSALLAEYHDKAAELEYQEQLEELQFNSKRREDGNVITPGGMCASVVRYARPQKARSASGEWKYIVNTGRHTQTLRLEKCSTPQESCSYLSHNYRSRCTQVYNYHRLLSWDKSRGLHVDIFKVPTCCSCQVDGFRETFPPIGGSKHKEYKDFTSVQNHSPYITVNDEIDYEDEDDEDSILPYQFGSGLKKTKHDPYHNSDLLLGSSNVKTKVNPPRYNPTVGSYLSPPSGSFETQTVLQGVRPTFGGRSRKPYKSYVPNESRVDLEISGTEQADKEVRPYSMNDNTRLQQKRTRIYSEAPNVGSPYQTIRPIVSSESNPSYNPTIEHTTLSNTKTIASTRSSPIRKDVGNGKRINYNYHPIIDFFESHQKAAKGQSLGRNSATNNIPISSETITSRDRRIAYGLGGVENNWHPLVVNR